MTCDYYFYEASVKPAKTSMAIKKLNEKSCKGIYLPHQSIGRYKPAQLPNSTIYCTIPFAVEASGLYKVLANYFKKGPNKYLFFGSGSTVFRAINVAIIKGARSISLHGLDLDNRYISQIETEHDYDTGQVNEVHLTESPLKKIRASFYLKTLLELKKR